MGLNAAWTRRAQTVKLRRLADRFGEAAGTCTSMEELGALLADATHELGFRYYALLHHAAAGHGAEGLIRLDNYPVPWVEELIESGLIEDDPVHLASRRSGTGFQWRELGRLIPLRPRHVRILERSRHHGLGDGLTIPINVPGEPAGSCSFATVVGSECPRQNILCSALIGSLAFGAGRRILDLPRRPERPHLSRRETQCLRLLAAGKTDWEISVILGISTDTVRQYVKRARAAYDVVSRAQLVVFGLRDDRLIFEDAVEPRI